MCSDPAAASHMCALFSATGVMFLSFIGFLLMKQPFLVFSVKDPAEYELAKQSAFGGAALYFFTFLVSVFYLLKTGRQEMTGYAGRGQTNRYGEYSNVTALDSPEYNVTEGNGFYT